MLIDCDGCAVRDLACGDCVVTVLLDSAGPAREVDAGERRALDVLADSGLVPRLRLVPVGPPGRGPPTLRCVVSSCGRGVSSAGAGAGRAVRTGRRLPEPASARAS